MKYTLPIPILIITVYLLTTLVVPCIFRSQTIFLVDVALWTTVIATTLLFSKYQQVKMWRTDKTILQFATVIATLQLFFVVFASFFMGFGRNANVWTPSALAVYFPYLLVPFLAVELSRAYLTQTTGKHKPTLTLLLISIFYTLIATTTSRYTSLTTPLAISKFLIETFTPTLAISLLATYFAYLGGFTANLTYMAIPAFFTWFSPILPNTPWAAQSMITVIATTIGFLILDQTVKPPSTKRIHRTLKKQKSQLPYWTGIALIGLVVVWSSVGLLGFTPSVIVSGSMSPTLNPGDIAIIISAPPQKIKIGDIIQYYAADMTVIHRVIDTYRAGGTRWFITKGDANTEPDDPVNQNQVIGKSVFTILQLGWVSVALKDLAANTFTFLTTTLSQTLTTAWTWITTNSVYISSALAFVSYAYLLFTYKDHRKGGKTQNE
jgi:signal peptidase I